ncbi:hypothetical protein [Geothrix oryzisoli]|uniref:hypothetical protein n=1 Tax=Geothrix oryzisoli TaxID=2922721 RepID=UPI001FAC44EF|nr:hypothetical protein [Geothrix oryzisoli]
MPKLRFQTETSEARPIPPQGLFSVMCWPQEPEKMKGFLGVEFFRLMEQADAQPQLRDNPDFIQGLEFIRKQLGGWTSISNMPKSHEVFADMKNRMMRGNWVGGTLCMAYILRKNHSGQIEGEISLRRLWTFLFQTRNQYFPKPPKKEALREAWDEFKSVAHLWAANFFINQWMAETLADRTKESLVHLEIQSPTQETVTEIILSHHVPLVLALAKDFEEFGLNFKPSHSRKPLLDPERLWTLEDVPNRSFPFPKIILSDQILEIFNDA